MPLRQTGVKGSCSVSVTENRPMLNDPMYTVALEPSAASNPGNSNGLIQMRTRDFADGRTVRVGSVTDEAGVVKNYVMTISHSLTKENAPYSTQRSVIRLDESHVTESGKTLTTSAYLVVAAPISATVGDRGLSVAHTLLSTALFGAKTSAAPAVKDATTIPDFLFRVLQGEP